MPLCDLPVDVLGRIAGHLDQESRLHLFGTCQTLRKTGQAVGPALWTRVEVARPCTAAVKFLTGPAAGCTTLCVRVAVARVDLLHFLRRLVRRGVAARLRHLQLECLRARKVDGRIASEVQKFTALRTLRLHFHRIDWDCDLDFEPSACDWKHLRELTIVEMRRPFLAPLPPFFARPPVPRLGIWLNGCQARMPRVHTLVLQGHSTDFLGFGCPRRLQTAILRCEHPIPLEIRAGSTATTTTTTKPLQNLFLDMGYAMDKRHFQRSLSRAPFPKCTTLTLASRQDLRLALPLRCKNLVLLCMKSYMEFCVDFSAVQDLDSLAVQSDDPAHEGMALRITNVPDLPQFTAWAQRTRLDLTSEHLRIDFQ